VLVVAEAVVTLAVLAHTVPARFLLDREAPAVVEAVERTQVVDLARRTTAAVEVVLEVP
jgi:hypothetical protein